MKVYIKESLNNIHRITNEFDRSGYLRLDMNENPTGLPQEFIDDVLQNITPEFISTYPNQHHFIKAYSEYESLPPECIRPTNGSDMGIKMIFESFGKKGSKVIGVTPSFEMYRIYSEIYEMTYSPIPYNSLKYPTKEIIESIDETTSIVTILNPNNPIGDLIPEEDVISIVEKAKICNAMVIIDEAYHFFCEKTYKKLIHTYSNVIILRTFSKIFSIAACRLGVVLSNPNNIQILFNTQPSFDVNSIALLFGEKLMRSPALIKKLINEFKSGKKFITEWLISKKYQYLPTEGNYISFIPNIGAIKLKNKLFEQKILVKTYSDPILNNYIRITIGNIDTMTYLTKHIEELDKE